MRKLLRTTSVLCCVGGTVLLGIFWRAGGQHWQVKPGTTITERPKKASQLDFERRLAELPIVDFTEFDPFASTDPTRVARNTKYNVGLSVDGIPAPKLEEKMQPVYFSLPMTHWRAAPAFPVTSDVIVIGTVQDAKAYLSTDRTDVYSEVSLSIQEILKAGPQYGLQIGKTISADREGGGIRFPSGKIVRRGFVGRNIPTTGHRYLLFLKDDPGVGFSIVTGYELTGQGVQPLDGGVGNADSVYVNYEKLRNTSEASLLDAVRKAINETGSGGGGVQ